MKKKTKAPAANCNLGKMVRAKLAAAGVSQDEFATRNNLDHDAFRTQLARNRYSEATLRVLAALLGCTPPELKRTYEIENEMMPNPDAGTISPLQATKRLIERSLRIVSRSTLKPYVQRLYDSMDHTSLAVIFALSQPPLECTISGWEAVGEAMTNAVKRKATFVYVRPSEAYYEQLLKVLPEAVAGASSPQQQHDWLQARLSDGEVERELLCSRVILCQPSWCPFWAEGMRWGFFVSDNPSAGREMDLFARFPYGGTKRGDLAVDPSLLIFTDEKTREVCRSYLKHCFKSAVELRSKPLQSRLQELLKLS